MADSKPAPTEASATGEVEPVQEPPPHSVTKTFEAQEWSGEHQQVEIPVVEVKVEPLTAAEPHHEEPVVVPIDEEKVIASSVHHDTLPSNTIISNVVDGVPVVQGLAGVPKDEATHFVPVEAHGKTFQAEEWSGVHPEHQQPPKTEVGEAEGDVTISPLATPPPEVAACFAAPPSADVVQIPVKIEPVPAKEQAPFSISIPVRQPSPFSFEIPVKQEPNFSYEIPVKVPAPFTVEVPVCLGEQSSSTQSVASEAPFSVEIPVCLSQAGSSTVPQKVAVKHADPVFMTAEAVPPSGEPAKVADEAAEKIRTCIPACGLTPDVEKQLSDLVAEMQEYAHSTQAGSQTQIEMHYSKKKTTKTTVQTSGDGTAEPASEPHPQLSPVEPPTPEVATQVLKNLSSLFESVAKPGAQAGQEIHIKSEYSRHRTEQTTTQEGGAGQQRVETVATGHVPVIDGVYNGVPVNGGMTNQVVGQVAVCPSAKPAIDLKPAVCPAAPPSFVSAAHPPSHVTASGVGVEMLESLQSQLSKLGLSGDHPVSQLVQHTLQQSAGPGSNVSVQYSSHRTQSTRTVTYEGQGDPGSAQTMFDQTLKSLQNVGQQQQQQVVQQVQQQVQQQAQQQLQTVEHDEANTSQQRESVEEGYVDDEGNVVISKKVTRIVTTTKTVYDGDEQKTTTETSRSVHGSSSDTAGSGPEFKE